MTTLQPGDVVVKEYDPDGPIGVIKEIYPHPSGDFATAVVVWDGSLYGTVHRADLLRRACDVFPDAIHGVHLATLWVPTDAFEGSVREWASYTHPAATAVQMLGNELVAQIADQDVCLDDGIVPVPVDYITDAFADAVLEWALSAEE